MQQVIEAIDSRINIGLRYAFKLQEYSEFSASLYLNNMDVEAEVANIMAEIEHTGVELRESTWALDSALNALSDDDPILEAVQDLGIELWEIAQVTMKLTRSICRHDGRRIIDIRLRDVRETYASIHERYRRLIRTIDEL